MGHSIGRSHFIFQKVLISLFLFLSQAAHANWSVVGEAQAKWAGFISIYDAKLYSPIEISPDNALAHETPLKLELCYHRSIDREDIIKAANKALPDQLPNDVKTSIDQLHNRYQSVAKGDCYTLEHRPEKGTVLALNNTPIYETRTQGFKETYFSIWLGENALSKDVRDQILSAKPR